MTSDPGWRVLNNSAFFVNAASKQSAAAKKSEILRKASCATAHARVRLGVGV
jgi:hypothetical protein